MDPSLWSVDHVVAQACARNSELYSTLQVKPILNLQTLENAFRDNDIDGESLLALEDANVKEDLGISSFGQRREVRKIIQHLRDLSPLYKASLEPTKRAHESESEETSEKTPEPNKRRRIQPENLSTEPLTRPEEFDPEELEDDWKDFLQRHQEDAGEEVLRPYNESDAEILLSDLESEISAAENTKESRLQPEQIQSAIDEAIQEYRSSWNTHKRAKKHKTAFRRWMQAANAGTRRPQQNALERELKQFGARLAKFRQHIGDASNEYHRDEEVKRNCLNLQATVEDIAEREYYLEALNSNEPPQQPPDTAAPEPQETLSEGEEILQSSDSELDAGSQSGDAMSLASEDESELSLEYDLADEEWKPQIPQPGGELHGRTAISEAPDLPASGVTPEFDLDQTLPGEALPPSVAFELPVGTPRRSLEVAEREPRTSFDSPDGLVELDEDSDLDAPRLPQSRYRQQGFKDIPITVDSSPSASQLSQPSDTSMRTPPLNPIDQGTPTKMKFEHRRPFQFQFPDISDTRSLKWVDIGQDSMLALCKIVYRHSRANARDVLEHMSQFSPWEVAEGLRSGIAMIQDTEDDFDERGLDAPILWAFFFVVFAFCKGYRDVWEVSEQKLDAAYEATNEKAGQFAKALKPLLQFYIDTHTTPASKHLQRTTMQTLPPSGLSGRGIDLGNVPTSGHQSYAKSSTKSPWTDSETDIEEAPTKGKRKRAVLQSQEVLTQQRDDRDRVQVQEERRRMMMERFQSQATSAEERYIPINTEEPIIYLDQHIARRIKEHQITGIQFIWRELIEDQKHQGCLLAHTMGLGKTMQVVSFLVTLAQVNASTNPKVRDLVPSSLRSKKVLVMCPASLVDNWFDEILMWTPDDETLGPVYKVFGSRVSKMATIREWSADPGVLLTSYESIRSLINNKKNISPEDLEYLEDALLKQPCIVIGDEAHKMKNAKSAINQLAKEFKTTSRIALTGSPLNNHLEEYHTMIDWIAPGYLGNITQFKAKYSEPIERGIEEGATKYEKRKSLEKLYVLKRDLAPKIDRKDISAIAADMPQKTEFFITVPLTEVQTEIYSTMVKHILSGIGSANGNTPKSSNAQLWVWLSILSWLCNHPACLIRKLEEKNVDANRTIVLEEGSVLPVDQDLTGSPVAALLPRFLEILQAAHTLAHMNDPSLSVRAMVSQRLIEESVAQGEKILLFSHSIPTLDYLESMLNGMGYGYLRIDGSTRTDQRQLATKHFNEADSDYIVFLISTRAGGLGLNLQGATRVIIYDFGFNPSWEEQAIGRAYRLGQKKPVYVYRFRAGGTFEEAIYNRSIFKTQLFSRVVDQKNVVRAGSKKIEDYLFVPKDVVQVDLSECRGKDALLDRIIDSEPDAIRNLVLTETFQREDEEDELTADEKKRADAEVEMERLLRINPQEYARRIHEKNVKDAAERQRRDAISQPVVVNGGGQLHSTGFGQFWQPALPSQVPIRPMLDGSMDDSEGGILETGEPARPPGCEQQ
ncbi:hypothetical protein PMZ80_005709 [Knufia obscura]|uniref:SNF2 family helicase/ATPase n=1 Tax=Knufia obscura TaxID=1635080 RepID=A0ABR0RMD9_9EURO|nr:hypothetical protein PMZ80_005709 [Knufia obscura]